MVITGCVAAALVALLPWRWSLVAGGITLLVLALLAGRATVPTATAATVSPLLVACTFLLVALLRRLWWERRQALRLLQAERDARLADQRAAAAAERARIARDLHDGLTHHLSALLLQVRSARALVEDHDLAGARQRLDSSAELARRSLVEARDVIEVLHSGPKDLAVLEDVTHDWEQATGRQVTLRLPDGVVRLDGARWGAVLSTVREGLTNVARHSTNTHVEVEVEVDESVGVRVRIADSIPDPSLPRPPALGGGHGLIGLTERAALLGGTVHTGPTTQGWRLELTVSARSQGTDSAPLPSVGVITGDCQ